MTAIYDDETAFFRTLKGVGLQKLKEENVNISKAFSVSEDIYNVVPRCSVLGSFGIDSFMNNIFIILTSCNKCNYPYDNILHLTESFSTMFKNVIEKVFVNLEN